MFGLPIPEPLVRLLAFVLAAICLILIGRAWGQHAVFQEWMASNEKARIQAVKIIQKQDVVTERVVTQFLDRIVQLEGVNTTIEKEVTRYVEGKPLALACMLDARWLQLHDAAAAGAVPPAAGGADGTAGGITAAQALPTITGNYGTANAIREHLIALQAWVRKQYEATNGEPLEAPAKPP